MDGTYQDYYNYDITGYEGADNFGFEAFGVFIIMIFFFALFVGLIYFFISQYPIYKMNKNLGHKNPGLAFVPFVGYYYQLKLAKLKTESIIILYILMLVPYFGLFYVNSSFLTILSIIIRVFVWSRTFKVLNIQSNTRLVFTILFGPIALFGEPLKTNYFKNYDEVIPGQFWNLEPEIEKSNLNTFEDTDEVEINNNHSENKTTDNEINDNYSENKTTDSEINDNYSENKTTDNEINNDYK